MSKKTVVIALVEGIEDTLSSHSEAPRYEGWLLPLTILKGGFSADSALDKVEYTGAMRYDQILVNQVSVKEWNAFSTWVHFLCNEGVPVLDSTSVLFKDIFKENNSEVGLMDTFSVSTENRESPLLSLENDLKSLVLYTTDNYLGDCDLTEFHRYVTNQFDCETSKDADKIVERAMKVYRIIFALLTSAGNGSGANNALVVGSFKNLSSL